MQKTSTTEKQIDIRKGEIFTSFKPSTMETILQFLGSIWDLGFNKFYGMVERRF
jgi:hypothetical protein